MLLNTGDKPVPSQKGLLTTVHSYTNSQKVLDVVSDDLVLDRRYRDVDA